MVVLFQYMEVSQLLLQLREQLAQGLQQVIDRAQAEGVQLWRGGFC